MRDPTVAHSGDAAINDKEVGEGRVEKTVPGRFGIDAFGVSYFPTSKVGGGEVMDNVHRAALWLICLFMLGNGLAFWFAIDTINSLYALSTTAPLGRASIRADFGGFFLWQALMSGYAALYRYAPAALGAAILFFIALSGRIVTLIFDGPIPDGVLPMIVEATCGIILLFAALRWRGA